MAKAGVSGTGMAVVPILASIYGSKLSTGFLLPILIIADIAAVIYYHRHTQWHHIIRLLPSTILGILAGTYVGNSISDKAFTWLLGIIIISGVVIMIWRDIKRVEKIPTHPFLAILLGFLGGFTTMVGNAAGPVLALYLLSMKLPKNSFIGTAAWFFFIVNLIKVPLHIWVWHTITVSSFTFNLLLAPIIIGGIFLGIKIVKMISNKGYKYLVLGTVILSVIFLFL